MNNETLLHRVAPCALLCHTCPAYVDGAIQEHASALRRYFEGYHDFNDAHIPDEHRGWLEQFAAFQARVERYARPGCAGCRNQPTPGRGCIEGCFIPACAAAHGVDFCGECAGFPCARVDTEEPLCGNAVLRSDWREGSARIREVGAARYFEEKRTISHYIRYKKA